VRQFLGLGLDEAAPDHSTISRTRRLIDVEAHQAVFTGVQERLVQAHLLRGKTLAVDAHTRRGSPGRDYAIHLEHWYDALAVRRRWGGGTAGKLEHVFRAPHRAGWSCSALAALIEAVMRVIDTEPGRPKAESAVEARCQPRTNETRLCRGAGWRGGERRFRQLGLYVAYAQHLMSPVARSACGTPG
jgi:hypothetical protein